VNCFHPRYCRAPKDLRLASWSRPAFDSARWSRRPKVERPNRVLPRHAAAAGRRSATDFCEMRAGQRTPRLAAAVPAGEYAEAVIPSALFGGGSPISRPLSTSRSWNTSRRPLVTPATRHKTPVLQFGFFGGVETSQDVLDHLDPESATRRGYFRAAPRTAFASEQRLAQGENRPVSSAAQPMRGYASGIVSSLHPRSRVQSVPPGTYE